MTENALITSADLKFTDISGQQGQNFVLHLMLRTATGDVGIDFNPTKLPQLLKFLKLKSFKELEGTYVQVNDTSYGSKVNGILPILAEYEDDWFLTDNDIYFGSKFISYAKSEYLNAEIECIKGVRDDFINMLNKLQANPTDKILQSQARDMIMFMGVEPYER